MIEPDDSLQPCDAELLVNDPALPELIALGMEMLDSGNPLDIASLCAARPDLLVEVEKALATGRRLHTIPQQPHAPDRWIGRVLQSRYRLDERIGSGAMGVVYRGYDIDLGRPIAVKILRALLIDGVEAERRFEREAEILAALEHGAIVRIFDRGRTRDDDPFLVMELVPGVPLQVLLDERKQRGVGAQSNAWGEEADSLRSDLNSRGGSRAATLESSYLRTVVRWAADLAGGLEAAHGVGVFHRDVKPSNVLIRSDGHAVLIDFGIASMGGGETITREGQPLGTPAYTAPEALDANTSPQPSLDVYGLAALLYHAVAMRPPYTGTPSQILAHLDVKDPPPVGHVSPQLPKDLVAVIETGMSRSLSDRYASAAEFESDLRAFLDHRPVMARPISKAKRLVRRLRRSRAFLAAALVALCALGLWAGSRLREDAIVRQDRIAFAGLRRIPPNLGFGNEENRRTTSPEEYQAIRSALDAAAAHDRHQIPAGVIRAAFLHDHGELAEAKAGMQRVAKEVGTAYAASLFDAYAALEQGSTAAEDLDLSTLPAPVTPADRYLAFFHALRTYRYGDIGALLAARTDSETAAFEGLSLLFALDRPPEVQDRSLALEGRLGGRTANSANTLGLALTFQRRDATALAVYEEMLEVAPYSYILYENAMKPAWRLEQYEKAFAFCHRAIALRPEAILPRQNLVLLHLTRKEYDDAQREWKQAPFDDTPKERGMRCILAGEIRVAKAFFARRNGALDEARRIATEGQTWFARAEKHGENLSNYWRAGVCAAFLRGDDQAVEDGFFLEAAKNPLSADHLEFLFDFLPTAADGEAPSAQRIYLEALHAALSSRAYIDPRRIAERLPVSSRDD